MGVAGECPGSFGEPSGLDGASREEFGGTCGERSGVERRGRTGCAARPLEKPERAWRRRSRASERDLLVLPLCPPLLNSSPCAPGPEGCRRFHSEPQARRSRLSGSAPSGRVVRRWGAGRHLVRAVWGWRGAGFSLCSGQVHVSWLSRVLTCSRTLLIAAPRGIPQRPPANPVGELGALQLLSAALLGARGAGRLRGDPAPRRLRGRNRSPQPAPEPQAAGCRVQDFLVTHFA